MLLCGNSAIHLLPGGITFHAWTYCWVWPRALGKQHSPRLCQPLLLSQGAPLCWAWARGRGWGEGPVVLCEDWLTAALSCCLCVLAWAGFQGSLLDHRWAADPLWTTPSLPLPIGSPSREQSAKAKRGPGSSSGDRVVVLVGKAVSFQREPECRACTPREWCQGWPRLKFVLGSLTPYHAGAFNMGYWLSWISVMVVSGVWLNQWSKGNFIKLCCMYAPLTNPGSSDSRRLGMGSRSLAVWLTGALVTSEVSRLILCCSETPQASNKELLIRTCGWCVNNDPHWSVHPCRQNGSVVCETSSFHKLLFSLQPRWWLRPEAGEGREGQLLADV